jgi:pSer/pThr/pTyr-binding forkhead associated (FHA) protein
LASLLRGGTGTGLFSGPVWRIVALTPMGVMLGLAIGASSMSQKRMIQGAIGGAIGSAIGAGVFDILGNMLGVFQLTLNNVQPGQSGEIGSVPRAVYASSMGGFIGLFIGIVDLMSRSAWVRLHLGRNEGKEWSLDFSNTAIGRSESAQIPLFGDPNVAPTHAMIRKHGNQYILQDAGTPIGTWVNGQRIQQAELRSGDTIQIAGFVLQFMMKNQPAPVRMIDNVPMNPYAGGPLPGNLPGGGYAQPTYPPPGNQTVAYPAAPNPSQTPTQISGYGVPAGALNQTIAYGVAPVPTGFCIVILDGPLAGQRVTVSGPTELGRGSTVIAMAYDQQASRRHAQLSPDPGGIGVADLGSTNGTFVNGQRINAGLARVGDIIRIGSTSFRVEPV